MNHSDLKDTGPRHPRLVIETDADGCLYERQSRRLLEHLPPPARSGLEALAAMRIAGKQMHMHMERWAERHGLSEGRLQVLFRLMRVPDRALAMTDLAAGLNVSARNVTGLVDHLEKDGLVERVPDPADRRSIQARLTPRGVEKIESVWKEGINQQVPLTQEFTKEELAQLRHLCLRLVQRMNELGRTE